jgi:hypothetical protein
MYVWMYVNHLWLRKIWGFHGGDYEEWCLLGCYAVWLLKEAPYSSETSVLTRATRRNNPEDTILLWLRLQLNKRLLLKMYDVRSRYCCLLLLSFLIFASISYNTDFERNDKYLLLFWVYQLWWQNIILFGSSRNKFHYIISTSVFSVMLFQINLEFCSYIIIYFVMWNYVVCVPSSKILISAEANLMSCSTNYRAVLSCDIPNFGFYSVL